MNPFKSINLTLFFSALLLINLSHAQATQIGLLCVAPSEIPMIFKGDLANERSQYFSLSQGIWKSFAYTEVRIEELIMMPRGSSFGAGYWLTGAGASRGMGKVHVNRTTLEWETPTPPPHGNFTKEVKVYRDPYEYSVPGAQEDFTPQAQPSK